MPADQQTCFKRRRANPIETCGIIIGFFRTKEWLERRIVHHNAHHRPIACGLAIEMFARDNATSARHIAWYDFWVARNMFSDMAANGARQGIIAAAHAGADDHGDIFIGVEFRNICFR